MSPWKSLKKQIPWDWIWGHFRVIIMHATLAIWPIESYSYGYCVGGSGISMLILCCCICSIFGSWFPQRSESCTKLLSISLLSFHRGHADLAKYHIIWATFSRCLLLDAFSLACSAIQLVSVYVTATSWQTINHLNSLSWTYCGENWIYAKRIYQFSQSCHFCWVLKYTLHGSLSMHNRK